MKAHRWMMTLAFVLAVSMMVGLGTAHAAIGPVDATGQLLAAANVQFTVSIFDPVTRRDITDAWLPEWSPPPTGQPIASGGTPVYVVFHDATGTLVIPSSRTLVRPTTAQASAASFTGAVNPFRNPLSTSAYPGQCTNFGSPSDFSVDFEFDTTNPVQFTTSTGLVKTGFRLTPLDCGGMAVITATSGTTTHTFILPRSSSGLNTITGISGIPDIWAVAFCLPANPCPTGREDSDGSAGNAVNGDGISAFDEYRGFIVSGVHIRTDPGRKDLFVHLVNPQCGTDSLLGGGTTTYVSGNALFSNVDTLISGTQVHRLGYATPNAQHVTTNEWVDYFHHYSVADGLRFGDGTITTAPADDRRVNQNAVFSILNSTIVGQKGLRIIECVDETTSPSLFGFASLGSPNGPDNAILFTKRIVNYFTTSLGATCATSTPACLAYSTFQNGLWTTPVAISPFSLLGVAFSFYLGMEIGHTIELTPTVEGTNRTSYGYHHAPGTGSNLDQAITNKVGTKPGSNTFYIPLLYNTSDLATYKVK